MKAIILAAGMGTRLRPYTDNIPKALMQFQNHAIIDLQLNSIKKEGIKDITLVTGYKSELLKNFGCQVEHNPDYAKTNMVSTLFCASNTMLKGGDLIISYGDIIYEPDVLHKLIDSKAPLSIVSDAEWRRYWDKRTENILSDIETFKMTDANKIIELGKKPDSLNEIQGQFIGLIKVREDHVALLLDMYEKIKLKMGDNIVSKMYMTDFLQYLIDNNWDTEAIEIQNGWLEFDTIEDIDAYEKLLEDGQLTMLFNIEKVLN